MTSPQPVHPSPARLPRARPARRRPAHPAHRTIAAAAATVALVLVMSVDADAASVHAASVQAQSMFGGLRQPGDAAFIAGHRGDRATAPENTLPAIAAVLESEMEYVEIDVQKSLDGEPVIIHDETVDRTTDGTGLVAELTWAQLSALDAGSWYAGEYAGTRIPHFDEFIALFRGSQKKALVELKGEWSVDEIRPLVREIYAAGVQSRIVFASFAFATMHHLVDAAPNLPRVIIRRDLQFDPVWLAEFYRAAAVLTRLQAVEEDPGVVDRMHEAGYGLLLYTLNSEERWSEALDYGVDGIITDEPSELDAWLANTAPGT